MEKEILHDIVAPSKMYSTVKSTLFYAVLRHEVPSFTAMLCQVVSVMLLLLAMHAYACIYKVTV